MRFINAEMLEQDGRWFVRATTGVNGGGHRFGPFFHADAIAKFDDCNSGAAMCTCPHGVAGINGECRTGEAA